MVAEQGCLTLTQPQVVTGTVTVTPIVPPTTGIATVRRTLKHGNQAAVIDTPVVATKNGNNLVITLPRGRIFAGDMVCWTSYS